MREDHFFAELDLRKVMEYREKQMIEEIDGFSENQVLNTAPEDLVQFVVEKYRIEPVRLLKDQMRADVDDVQVDVSRDPHRVVFNRSKPLMRPGTATTVEIPFEGEEDLFRCVASKRSLSPPRGAVDGRLVKHRITQTNPDANEVRKGIDEWVREIETNLERIENDLNPWNDRLPQSARARLERRRKKFLDDRNFGEALGIPLKRRDDDPGTYITQEVRRKSPPTPPRPSSEPYKPEPAISDGEYEHILDVIRRSAVMLERSPTAFSGMDEEQLRDQFLVTLNSHYEGSATGETFNASGKTDILIRVKERNVFIAECKIWRGAKALSEAIDQLLGYMTWRDTKAALIVFNKNRNLSNVLVQVPDTLKAHGSFKRARNVEGETSFRVVLASPGDPNREILLTVLVFDVPAKADK